MDIKAELQKIRDLEQTYLKQCNTTSGSLKSSNAFHAWHKAMFVFFSKLIPADNEDFRFIKNKDAVGNGAILRGIFDQISGRYEILMDEIANGNYSSPNQNEATANKTIGAKYPLVFISHASEDIDIIREFIDQILKNGLGLLDENIVCTSLEWTTVALGDNIPAYIHNNIEQSSVVLSMVSQAYKRSEPCQNEVGAAWALKRKPISIILPDANFNELGWLVNLDKAGKIDNADFLNHLQVDLCNHLGIQPKIALHWSPCVSKFLEYIKKLEHISKSEDNLKAKQSQLQKVETAEQKHDKDLFMSFDMDFSEEEIGYTLYSIQHTTHFSDFDLTTWHKIIHWFELTSNTFITNEVQNTANQLCGSFKKLIAFIGKANYSPDRISWCMDDDRNVTPEKWREIHEAKIYSWEPESYDNDFYHEREKMVLNEIPGIVENIENAYKVFRMCVKKYLFI